MSAEIQNQIRENADELKNFLRDLNHWEKDMKTKEEELKLIQVTEDQSCPPIRTSASKKRSRHREHPKEKIRSPKKNDPIPAYNYQAWEKFDVDSELKKLDEDKKESSCSDSSSNEEKIEVQKQKQLAILKKDKGNEFFKKGEYDSAINCYTIGIELDPENPLLSANRAMAFLKKEQFQAAEDDCSHCLTLDPTYVKAYLRRGNARVSLHKVALARKDFLKALELEPENKQAQQELAKIDKVMNIAQNKPNESKSSTLDKNELLSCNEEHEYSEKLTDMKSVKISQAVGESPKDPFKNRPTESESEKDPLVEIRGIIEALDGILPPVPTASFQFLTDWKAMHRCPEMKYRYLKQFPPERLPVLFRHSMEADIFPEIIHILSTSYLDNGDEIYDYMKFLTRVGRFDTMLMFLSRDEKKDLEKLLSFVKTMPHPSTEVEELLELYRI